MILIVDDSRVQRRIIGGIVESLGYESAEAENGQQALDMLCGAPASYELILLDWNMPVMTGLGFLQERQKIDEIKAIPVVMVTTESERSNVVSAIRAGANGYVTKPFTPETLAVKIVESLRADL